MKLKSNAKIAVWKLTSCSGCQASLLYCEAELMALVEALEFAYFPEASSRRVAGPYDVSLVEGSVTTAKEIERLETVRRQSKLLVAVGACATSGGIQALRNFGTLGDTASASCGSMDAASVFPYSTPLADHVKVDLELHGCPVSKEQLLEVLNALLAGRKPNLPDWSVCEQCKQTGTTCLTVSRGIPCLGPVTAAGCGGICPGYGRGCFGCFGPKEGANVAALVALFRRLEVPEPDIVRAFRNICANAPAFRGAVEELRP